MKRQYFAYLAEAQGHSERSIDAVAKATVRFEAYARFKDFKAFHIEQAKAFKRDLADQRSHRSREQLSKATLYATLTALRARESPRRCVRRGFRPWSRYITPATKIAVSDNLRFRVVGLHRKHWSNSGPIRTIFKAAFEAVGLQYFKPHSFR